jgi:hypothetical protein
MVSTNISLLWTWKHRPWISHEIIWFRSYFGAIFRIKCSFWGKDTKLFLTCFLELGGVLICLIKPLYSIFMAWMKGAVARDRPVDEFVSLSSITFIAHTIPHFVEETSYNRYARFSFLVVNVLFLSEHSNRTWWDYSQGSWHGDRANFAHGLVARCLLPQNHSI